MDAAKRVAAGEAFDLVVLASDAIDKLLKAGHLRAGSRAGLVHSGVGVAVKAGAALPVVQRQRCRPHGGPGREDRLQGQGMVRELQIQ